jgi:hypothetical protein
VNVINERLDGATHERNSCETWETEAEAAAAFDERIERCGLFERSFKEVRGYYLTHREEKTARIDRILIPGAKLRDAGWSKTIGIEIKRSNLESAEFGRAIGQAIDYTYCNWNVGAYWMYCERIFLWPFAMPQGPLQSVMLQNGVGVCYGQRYRNLPDADRSLVFRLERNNIVVQPDGALAECVDTNGGKRKGSR